jgi:SAM-dependent methyltransferase
MNNHYVSEKDKLFTLFEKQAWEISAVAYHQLFGEFTCRIADILLNAVKQVGQTDSLLDVATGPGYLAKFAKEHGYSNVVGVDFSGEMITIAETSSSVDLIPKAVKFKVGNAEQLEEIDSSFDAVTMNFGLLHLPQPLMAINEAYRVLKPGGKFGYTVWANPEQNIGFKLLLDAVDTFIDKSITIPDGPPFFYFSDTNNSYNALTNAGFININIKKIDLEWVVGSGDEFFNAFLKGGARIGGLLRLQSIATVDSIRNKIMSDAELYRNGDKLRIPICVALVVGTKPLEV